MWSHSLVERPNGHACTHLCMQSHPPPFAFPLRYRYFPSPPPAPANWRMYGAHALPFAAAVNVRAHGVRRKGEAEVKVRAEEADARAVARDRDTNENR